MLDKVASFATQVSGPARRSGAGSEVVYTILCDQPPPAPSTVLDVLLSMNEFRHCLGGYFKSFCLFLGGAFKQDNMKRARAISRFSRARDRGFRKPKDGRQHDSSFSFISGVDALKAVGRDCTTALAADPPQVLVPLRERPDAPQWADVGDLLITGSGEDEQQDGEAAGAAGAEEEEGAELPDAGGGGGGDEQQQGPGMEEPHEEEEAPAAGEEYIVFG